MIPRPVTFGHSLRGVEYRFSRTGSLLPGKGNTTLSFSRASNGMSYGSNGLLRNSPHNMFAKSQQLDDVYWSSGSISTVADQIIAPDGTVTADKLNASSTSNILHEKYKIGITLVQGAYYTVSAYLKAGEYNWGIMTFGDGVTNYRAYFNLTTGTVGTVPGGATATIAGAANGWYRCSISVASGGTSGGGSVGFTNADNTQTFVAAVGSGIYGWGVQLEQNLSVSDYVPTTTTAPVYGPRFDYDPSTLAPRGLLVEEARTNIATFSEQFDNAIWLKQSSGVAVPVVTANQVTAPDGTLTADKMVLPACSTVGNYSLINQLLSGMTAGTGTFSVWLKGAVGGEQTLIEIANLSGGTNLFPLSVTLTTSWQRFSVTASVVTGTNYILIGHDLRSGSGQVSGSACTIYAWGAQMEVGGFVTSYIPTTSATATRAIDSVSLALVSPADIAAQGTVVMEVTRMSNNTANPQEIYESNNSGSQNERFSIFFAAASNQIVFGTWVAGVALLVNGASDTPGTTFKAGISWGGLSGKTLVMSGGTIYTASHTFSTSAQNKIVLMNRDDLARPSSGWIKSFRYFNDRLPDQKLKTITL